MVAEGTAGPTYKRRTAAQVDKFVQQRIMMESTHVILQTAGDFRQHYVGKSITQLPKPALVLDKAKMHRHCKSLLDAVECLGVDFRAHVKTHKVHTDFLFQYPKLPKLTLDR